VVSVTDPYGCNFGFIDRISLRHRSENRRTVCHCVLKRICIRALSFQVEFLSHERKKWRLCCGSLKKKGGELYLISKVLNNVPNNTNGLPLYVMTYIDRPTDTVCEPW
jgi:hypothetical protein